LSDENKEKTTKNKKDDMPYYEKEEILKKKKFGFNAISKMLGLLKSTMFGKEVIKKMIWVCLYNNPIGIWWKFRQLHWF